MQLLLYTGVKRNEALQLIWSDIDLTTDEIIIRKEITKSRAIRKIAINSNLKLILEQWSNGQTGRLFPNYGANQISMKFRRWAREIGLPAEVKLHSLRATFACHLMVKGVDVYTISKLMGHRSIRITGKYYLAMDVYKSRDAVETLRYEADE
ncbi:MAG: site-specific integrase [Calditrichaeota bacterium]|nr:site-specific integrase [Calditrichota bacterium]